MKKNIVSRLPYRVTPYFRGVMAHAGDALTRQVEPSPEEAKRLESLSWDPLQEQKHMPIPGVVHRYPRIALVLVTHQCFAYCRYCFRAGYIDQPPSASIFDNLPRIRQYLASHHEIQEVLLTGGDPLTLGNADLWRVLSVIREVRSDIRIRIGTRAPVFQPKRISAALVKGLASFHPVAMYIHVNHPAEVTDHFSKVVRRLMRAEIFCYSQAVLLKGINDDIQILEQLFMALYMRGVHPAYLHLCDLAQGTEHFMVPLARATDLWRMLWGRLPGAAIPHLVFDDASSNGKIPLMDMPTVRNDPHPAIRGFGETEWTPYLF